MVSFLAQRSPNMFQFDTISSKTVSDNMKTWASNIAQQKKSLPTTT